MSEYMVVGLNRIDKMFLYQILEQMSKDNTETLTINREDVLKEIGARSFSEHMGQKVAGGGVEMRMREFQCELCEFASLSEVGLTKHRNARHLRTIDATIGEFAVVTKK